MEIVIDIPEEVISTTWSQGYIVDEDNEILTEAIKNCKVLSKGHGRSIDVNDLLDDINITPKARNDMPKHRNIPQAIMIYEDNAPQRTAEKLYQICKGEKLKEVIWWLQKYAESEETE